MRSRKTRAEIVLINHGPRAITIERLETSCPCLAIVPNSFRINPSERQVLAVEFDLSTETEFRGGLSIDVTGYAAESTAFHTKVELEVPAERHAEFVELVPSPREEARP